MYLNFEKELLTQTSMLVNPLSQEFIIKELLYDFIVLMLDKTSDFNQRAADLERLKKCVEDKNGCKIQLEWTYKQFVKEFEKLSENKRIYDFENIKKKAILKNEKIIEESCQFKPVLNTNKEKDEGNRYESLYRNYQEKEDKILCSKLTAMEKEMNECTFAPKILGNRGCSLSSKKSDDHKNEKKTTIQSFLEKELEQCTFKPEICKGSVKVPSNVPKGFDEFVKKSRKIIQEKVFLQEKEKRPIGKNYEKMKNLKFNPPSFLNREKEDKSILVFIDVNVALGKKGKLALRRGDDPRQVAENFCKVYSLGKNYEENLEEALIEQLNDIEINDL